MTSLVMFANINEPLLTKLKEHHDTVDLDWITAQSAMVSQLQKNVVRATHDDGAAIHVVVFPREFQVEAPNKRTDPQHVAWVAECKVKPFKEHYAHGDTSVYVF